MDLKKKDISNKMIIALHNRIASENMILASLYKISLVESENDDYKTDGLFVASIFIKLAFVFFCLGILLKLTPISNILED